MHASLAAPDIFLRWTIAALYIAKRYPRDALRSEGAHDITTADAMYDEKDTPREKLLRWTERFCRNVTIFAGRLSKARRQLTLPRANGASSRIPAIFFLRNRAAIRIDFSRAPHEKSKADIHELQERS